MILTGSGYMQVGQAQQRTIPDRVQAQVTADAPGIIVVGRDRRILFKNPHAQAILGADHALKERHNALLTSVPAIELPIRDAFSSDTASDPHMISLPRPGGMPLLGLVISLIGTDVDALGALLLIWDPQSVRLLPVSALVQLFGLTPTEAQTALATYEGATPAEIAERRSRSVNTVRTQLSHVFAKCGVKRQAELVRLLAGIANMCSMADGIRTGMEIQNATHAAILRHAALRKLHDTLASQVGPTQSMESIARIRDFRPAEATPTHYHTHGYEVLCVLQGELTTDIVGSETWVTAPGEARYIGEHVLHRGYNPHPGETVQMLSIDVKRRGLEFRVDVD
jgi:DNA-binding CsgD family transcriptional regulator/quercetin dioxygenase-like cupin family protein